MKDYLRFFSALDNDDASLVQSSCYEGFEYKNPFPDGTAATPMHMAAAFGCPSVVSCFAGPRRIHAGRGSRR